MSDSDIEKGAKGPTVQEGSSGSGYAVDDAATGDVEEYPTFLTKFQSWISWTGAEQRGAAPVPVEQRMQTDYISVFTVFSTPMLSLLP